MGNPSDDFYEQEIDELEAENDKLRDALRWALRHIGPPVRRIVGQNEDYFDSYHRAVALVEETR